MEQIAQYPVRESLLYSVCHQMWLNCKNNLATFAAKRAIYTPDYVDERLAEIEAAEKLPNAVQRSCKHEIIRLDMVKQNTVCCDAFQLLKIYIRHAWPKEQFKTRYESAGSALYEESTHCNWSSLKSMMTQGKEFIAENREALMANSNMPGAFEEEFISTLTAFNELDTQFTEARQAAITGAEAKVEANNNIYNACIAMGADGQQFFKNTPKQFFFSFEALTNLISPSGSSKAVITVVNAETGRPMIAEVTDNSTGRTLATEDDGRCEMGNLAGGKSTFTVTADGYTQQTIELTLKTGTTGRITVQMIKAFTEQSIAQPVVLSEVPSEATAAFN